MFGRNGCIVYGIIDTGCYLILYRLTSSVSPLTSAGPIDGVAFPLFLDFLDFLLPTSLSIFCVCAGRLSEIVALFFPMMELL